MQNKTPWLRTSKSIIGILMSSNFLVYGAMLSLSDEKIFGIFRYLIELQYNYNCTACTFWDVLRAVVYN